MHSSCATANDPSNDPALGNSGAPNAAQAAHGANPGHQVLDAETTSKLDAPLSKEEVEKRTAELNK